MLRARVYDSGILKSVLAFELPPEACTAQYTCPHCNERVYLVAASSPYFIHDSEQRERCPLLEKYAGRN
jgi:hypothetical protein